MEVGVDIVEIARIREVYQAHGDAFLRRILTDAEIELCRSRPDPVETLAGRFAAKEALSKALGTGFGARLSWHSVEILSDQGGKPQVILHRCPDVRATVSISHDRHSAVAVALVIGQPS